MSLQKHAIATAMGRLSVEQRNALKKDRDKGFSFSRLSSKYGVSIGTVTKWVTRKYSNLHDKPRSGRPTKLNAKERTKVKRLADSKLMAAAIASKVNLKRKEKVSNSTVQRSLKRGRVPRLYRAAVTATSMRTANAKARISFAKRWSNRDKSNWVFIDGAHVYVRSFGKRAPRVFYQKPGVRKPQFVMQSALHYFFYSAVCSKGKMELLYLVPSKDGLKRPFDSHAYCTQVLNPVKKWADQLYGTNGWLLARDHAKVHVSKSTTKYCAQRGIRVVPSYPAQAQDVNVIENMWSDLKRRLLECKIVNTEAKTRAAIDRCWAEITQGQVNRCLQSLDRRLQLIIEGGGDMLVGY